MSITPQDFYGEHPPARLIGTESECNIQLVDNADPRHYISAKAIKATGLLSIGGFLNNGMRIYPDVEHLEVDSAECLGPAQAAAGDTAALQVLASVVVASGVAHNGLHAHSGTIIGERERTSGRHENYMIPRSVAGSELIDTVMASFLTSAVFKMAGSVKQGFRLSQKVKGIGDPPITREVERRTTHGNKPMAMIPPAASDGDTVGREEWARLEVRFADTCYSPAAKFLGFASTSLALRLIEHQDKIDLSALDGWIFKRHAETAHKFNEDLTFSDTAETANGKHISAVDFQEALASLSARLAEKIELPEDEVKAITLWLDICDRLRAADLSKGEYAGLLTLLDFAPRHRFLTQRFKGDLLDSNNNRAVEAHLTWDRILPIGGALSYWSNFSSEFVNEQEVKDLMVSPPLTRASLRSRLIANHPKRISQINWAKVKFDGKNIGLGNPYGKSA